MRQTSGTILSVDINARTVQVQTWDKKLYEVRVPRSKIASGEYEEDVVIPIKVDDIANFAEYDYSWKKED